MNLKKDLVVASFLETFKAIRKKKHYILYPVIIDIFFILSYGFISNIFITNIQEKAIKLIETGKSILSSGSLIKGVLTNNETLSIIITTLVFIIVTYVQYCIFQGLTWRFTRKFIEKVKFFQFIKKFFLVNIFWFGLFILIQVVDYIRRLLGYLRPQSGTSFLFSIIIFLMFLVTYFALISYALVNAYKTKEAVKKSFYLGITKIKHFLFMHLIIFSLFLIINIILVLASRINFILMVILGLILVSPAYTWSRIFLNLVVDKVDKNK